MGPEEHLTGKAKLAYEAALKIAEGQRLIAEGQKMNSEGTLELEHLFGKKEEKKKTVANRTVSASKFRKETRPDNIIKARILNFLKDNGRPSDKATIQTKLHLSKRAGDRILAEMEAEGVIKDLWNGKQGSRHRMTLTEGAASEDKKSWPKNFIPADINAERMLNFIKNTTWVTKLKLGNELKMSDKVVRRTLDHLIAEKKVIKVTKNQNPEHKSVPKCYARFGEYFEPAK